MEFTKGEQKYSLRIGEQAIKESLKHHAYSIYFNHKKQEYTEEELKALHVKKIVFLSDRYKECGIEPDSKSFLRQPDIFETWKRLAEITIRIDEIKEEKVKLEYKKGEFTEEDKQKMSELQDELDRIEKEAIPLLKESNS